jgi:hypothetical protein
MHFSYSSVPDLTNVTDEEKKTNARYCLAQGNLIKRTDAVNAILKADHAWCVNPGCVALCVVTQSCDLQWRYLDPKQPKPGTAEPHAFYVTAAVVKRFEDTVPAEEVANRFEQRRSVRRIQSFINQNDTSRGLFFLYPDDDVGIQDYWTVDLRALLSIPVSREAKGDHYLDLVNSRFATLNAEFATRLGWMAGNLFSRASVEDWEYYSKHTAKEGALQGDAKQPMSYDVLIETLFERVIRYRGVRDQLK